MQARASCGLGSRPTGLARRSATAPLRAAPAAAASRRRGPLRVAALLGSVTSNPAFTGTGRMDEAIVESRYSSRAPMTLSGTVNKTAALLALTAASAAGTWLQLLTGGPGAFAAVIAATQAAGVVAMVAAIASMFKPLWSPVTGPIYALAKGVALAGVSAYAEVMAPGIAFNAFLLTLSTAGSLMFALKANIIRVTDQCADTVRAVSGGFFLTMLITWGLSLVGFKLPGLFSSGPVALVVSLVSAGLAASNLLLDFSFAQQAAFSKSVPKKMEWYFAQSTLFSLVWCYMSILRLLMVLTGMGGSDD